ncbi:unnamed protein product [Brachionus calyciflorus]|uniref:Uridine 5'-monophosphate synthase n=1 Tax=Brachionus calyciflorus TaxID=104777 RepID=A0A813NK99_9BILA|nr:unnamed protein product [Brachionus calyciflorus]
MEIEELIIELFNIGCVKFGEFTLKSGLKSPVYFDLRILVSYPKLLKLASVIFAKKISDESIDFDIVCGVPYGAISLATGLCLEINKSMIFKRKDAKSHGTKNLIEGIYKPNDRCLIIDDVITSGISILETIEGLRDHGVQVKDALVLLDREQGGPENVIANNVKIHSVLKTSDVLNILLKRNKINQEMYNKTQEFLNVNRNVSVPTKPVKEKEISFEERAEITNNKMAKKLFQIMSLKQSNLCFSADVESFDLLLKLADEIGPNICILKTHIDILNDFNMDKVQELVNLSIKHNFLIFEDRKFADIGNTVKSQYSGGVYKISQWSNFVNAHSIAGSGCVQGLKEAALQYDEPKGCLLIAQLSCKNNLIDKTYTEKTVKLAEEHSDFIFGFICQNKLTDNPGFIHITPGIQFNENNGMSDNLGQQYTTPEMAILQNKCDVIVVGRGILKSENPAETALKYKNTAYEAYLKRLNL